MLDREMLPLGLTFDDVLLLPAESSIVPGDTDVRTRLTERVELNIPLLSAAMDTVTESRTAIAMAQAGGVGIVHRNLSVAAQASEVEKVKKFESGMITDPVTVRPEQMISEAKEILQRHRIEKLLVVDDRYQLKGLITVKDIEKKIQHPFACKDERGRLRVGAAVGVGPDCEERVEALVKSGADIIAVDTAHGHSKNVLEVVRLLRRKYPDLDILGGNVATEEGAEALIEAGVNAVKVGVGPGSICTTRVVSGVGVPQITAIASCARVAERHNIPIVSDGGVKYSGDITKALAAGASSVMIGSLFAGTEESPGETILYQGRTYKMYRGMGSLGAMKLGSRDRYGHSGMEEELKLVPEGIEGQVPYKGSLAFNIDQLVGGLRAGMGYVGCRSVRDLGTKARFIRVTTAGLREGHVHDVFITKEAPNYRAE